MPAGLAVPVSLALSSLRDSDGSYPGCLEPFASQEVARDIAASWLLRQ